MNPSDEGRRGAGANLRDSNQGRDSHSLTNAARIEAVPKILLARGARGELVRRAQVKLASAGTQVGKIDGSYGEGTARAVAAFRRRSGLGRADQIDVPTWEALVGRPIPSVRDRALQVTAAFEGHGFTLVQGNYDGAWLTWGVIGFTLKHGELPSIVLEAHRSGGSPGRTRSASARARLGSPSRGRRGSERSASSRPFRRSSSNGWTCASPKPARRLGRWA